MVWAVFRQRLVVPALGAALAAGIGLPAAAAPVCPAPARLKFEIAQTIERDRLGLTQGLEFRDGRLYESTGRIDNTTQLNVIAPSGKVTTLKDLGNSVFGEGLTILNDEIFQLTWKENKVFVYDLSGKLRRTMTNPRPGWGLTNDGKSLIFTDGGSSLIYADPKTFAITREVQVRLGARDVRDLNELERVGDHIFANIFLTKEIVRIDYATGCIDGVADLGVLWSAMGDAERQRIDRAANYVLNGIAYDGQTGLFYVTGKRWRYIFAGRFVEAPR